MRFTRSQAVFHTQRHLERTTSPRMQMGLIVTLTGLSGLLWSFTLLQAGVESMVWRYPLALAGAYLVFLFMLWLWLRTNGEDYADVPDLTNLEPNGNGRTTADPVHSSGGEFGGGGASGSFSDSSLGATPDVGALPSFSDATSSVAEADELAIPLVAVLLVIGLALASLYVVYMAPMLFAELLFDGLLSYTLYRRWRSADSQHWLTTAVQRTLLPFGMTAVFLVLVSVTMSVYAPEAHTLGQVIHHAKNQP